MGIKGYQSLVHFLAKILRPAFFVEPSRKLEFQLRGLSLTAVAGAMALKGQLFNWQTSTPRCSVSAPCDPRSFETQSDIETSTLPAAITKQLDGCTILREEMSGDGETHAAAILLERKEWLEDAICMFRVDARTVVLEDDPAGISVPARRDSDFSLALTFDPFQRVPEEYVKHLL